MEKNNNYAILALVGIVAVVGVIALVMSISPSGVDLDDSGFVVSENAAGEAVRSVDPTVISRDTYVPPVVYKGVDVYNSDGSWYTYAEDLESLNFEMAACGDDCYFD